MRWIPKFRFSMRTLMIVTAVICVILSSVVMRVKQVRQEHQAVTWVQEHYGSIRYQNQCVFHYGYKTYYKNAPSKIPNKDSSTPKWIRDFYEDNLFETIEHVQVGPDRYSSYRFEQREITHDVPPIQDLRLLAHFKSAKSITFSTYSISSQSDLSPLAGLKNLESITFEGEIIPNIAPLVGLENLHAIHLSSRSNSAIKIISN